MNEIQLTVGDVVYISNANCKRYGQKGIVKRTNFSRHGIPKTNKLLVLFDDGLEEIATINNVSTQPIFPYSENKILDDFRIWIRRTAHKSGMTENELFGLLSKKKKCGML